MKTNTIKPAAHVAEGDVFLGENWFDPLEAAVRTTRSWLHRRRCLEAELDAALTRDRAMRGGFALPKRRSPRKRRGGWPSARSS